jgi:hypothetical protein
VVKLLPDHGASLTMEEAGFQATPPDWFEHGLRNCKEDGSDYWIACCWPLALRFQLANYPQVTPR